MSKLRHWPGPPPAPSYFDFMAKRPVKAPVEEDTIEFQILPSLAEFAEGEHVMLADNDYVSGLQPREPSGRGRDELSGSADDARIHIKRWENEAFVYPSPEELAQVSLPSAPVLTLDNVVPFQSRTQRMVGVCRTCGRNITADRFFDNGGKCAGC